MSMVVKLKTLIVSGIADIDFPCRKLVLVEFSPNTF